MAVAGFAVTVPATWVTLVTWPMFPRPAWWAAWIVHPPLWLTTLEPVPTCEVTAITPACGETTMGRGPAAATCTTDVTWATFHAPAWCAATGQRTFPAGPWRTVHEAPP